MNRRARSARLQGWARLGGKDLNVGSLELSDAALGRTQRNERVATFVAVLVIVASICLCFKDLALTGLTWDEWADYGVAEDYYRQQAFLTNLGDPSQSRFSHMLAALSFAIVGESYFSFKLPFVVVGLLGAVLLWWFLRRLVRPAIAALVTALYISCPFVLSAARTAATAGDILVCVLTLAYVVTLRAWIQNRRFWPYGFGCGVVCGLAVGAKWTCGLFLVGVVLIWLLQLWREKRSIFDGEVWTQVLAQEWVAVSLSLLACPTLILGYPFVKDALAHSVQFGGLAMWQFGRNRVSAPWYYIPAVLISKLSPIQLAIVLGETLWGLFWWVRYRRRARMLSWICLVSLLPAVPLASKNFQNAQYYLVFVPAVMIASAVAAERWLRSGRTWLQRSALGILVFAVACQLVLSIALAPDYLLSGRQFGRLFYSQFAGPAVNHCQGQMFAIQELEELHAAGGPGTAYVLSSCLDIYYHHRSKGPIRPRVRTMPYPSQRPSMSHYLVIPTAFQYDSLNAGDWREHLRRTTQVTQGCRPAGKGHVDYALWFCPNKPR